MRAVFVRSILLLTLFPALVTTLHAQQNRFIYIQTETRQPFYIKMNKRILSSAASGYMIIAGLADSTYDLSFGFPKDEWPEQNVTVTVRDADAGYLLKNMAEKGWGLVNLQTQQLLMPVRKAEDKNAVPDEIMKDEFSTILAMVVNDPGIAQRPVVRKVEPEPGNTVEVKKAEAEPAAAKNEIIKLKYSVDPEGVNMAYLDIADGARDTIKLFVPVVKTINVQEPVRQEQSTGTPKAKEAVTNSRCRNHASYDDFISLRKLMAAEESYDTMINVARRKFRQSCYTTEQVKNLGTMFLSDEGKYKFYVVAYPFVSDSQNFAVLENQFTDKAFITKFKAILH